MKLRLTGLLLLFSMLLGMCGQTFAATANTVKTSCATQSSLETDCFSGAAEGLLPVTPEVVANNLSNCSLPYPDNKAFTPNYFKSITQASAQLLNYQRALQPCKVQQQRPIYIMVGLLLI